MTVGKLARPDVPVCRFDDKLADLQQRLGSNGWSECVVVNDPGIVLGLLRQSMWQGAVNETTAEQVMEPAPITFRPYVSCDEMLPYMQKKQLKSALVTAASGKLIGLLRLSDLEDAPSKAPRHDASGI